jgi:hypothetical protein
MMPTAPEQSQARRNLLTTIDVMLDFGFQSYGLFVIDKKPWA